PRRQAGSGRLEQERTDRQRCGSRAADPRTGPRGDRHLGGDGARTLAAGRHGRRGIERSPRRGDAMRPQVVVDIGNSRIKWGLCSADGQRLIATASLPEDSLAWQAQLTHWGSEPALNAARATPIWVLTSVRPQRCERLRDWLL